MGRPAAPAARAPVQAPATARSIDATSGAVIRGAIAVAVFAGCDQKPRSTTEQVKNLKK
jgi:hypothetical protein